MIIEGCTEGKAGGEGGSLLGTREAGHGCLSAHLTVPAPRRAQATRSLEMPDGGTHNTRMCFGDVKEPLTSQ